MSIVIEFGNGDGRKTFPSKEKLVEFLTQEKSNWREFFNNQNQGVIQQIRSGVNSQYDSAIQTANRITDDLSNSEQIANQISTFYKQFSVLKFNGKRGKFIAEIYNQDPILAMYIVGYFTKKLFPHSNDPLAFRAIFEGLKYDSGITSNIDSEKQALEELKSDWDKELSLLRENYTEINAQIETLKSEIDQYFENKKIEFDQIHINREQEFQNLIKAYDDKLALQAPVNYWDSKSKWNYRIAGILGIVFFLAISIILINFAPLAQNVSTGINQKDYYPLIQFSSLAIIAIWLLRIIVKIFYSKLHLAEEAREKEMFIKTYLSMLRETDGVKDESDRHLILQSIFTPSKNGIIKDDALPINIIENIVKAKMK